MAKGSGASIATGNPETDAANIELYCNLMNQADKMGIPADMLTEYLKLPKSQRPISPIDPFAGLDF